MKPSDQSRFDSLYQEHLNVLRLQGKAPATSWALTMITLYLLIN